MRSSTLASAGDSCLNSISGMDDPFIKALQRALIAFRFGMPRATGSRLTIIGFDVYVRPVSSNRLKYLA
jgi:hypothetical protein